jgi:hypothetical protein
MNAALQVAVQSSKALEALARSLPSGSPARFLVLVDSACNAPEDRAAASRAGVNAIGEAMVVEETGDLVILCANLPTLPRSVRHVVSFVDTKGAATLGDAIGCAFRKLRMKSFSRRAASSPDRNI